MARRHDQIAALLLGPHQGNAMGAFYGRYRSLDRRLGEPHQVTSAPAMIGPCAKCRRSRFQIKACELWRSGFAFNANSRLFIYLVERSHMRLAILRCPGVPATKTCSSA